MNKELNDLIDNFMKISKITPCNGKTTPCVGKITLYDGIYW